MVVFGLGEFRVKNFRPSWRGIKKEKRVLERFIVTGNHDYEFPHVSCGMVMPN